MDNHLQYWFLQNHYLLSRLNESELNELNAASKFKRATKDEIIYPYDQEINSINFLCQGRIKIAFSIEKNLEVVAEILKEGDVFGELTLRKSPNTHFEFAQVLSDEAFIFTLGLEVFENILKKNQALAVGFSKVLAAKLKIVTGKFFNLAFKDVRARVLNFFTLHAQYEGKWTGNKAEIKMYCTQKDIADFTASTRQTVSAVINDLIKEKKIIYEGRGKVIIPDINKLNA
jgi:CRP/FNR family transcriptional regulator, cyclic AMP receptor protein